MESNFDKAVSLVLQSEGGFVDHPRDPGGATKFGITFATLQQWRDPKALRDRRVTVADVKNLTTGEAKAIYKAKYWNNVRGDDLPVGVDYVVFDYAVNSGPAAAAKALQKIIGAAPDGIIGAFTVRSAEQYIKIHGAKKLIDAVCDRRLAFLKGLPTWVTFGRGWRNRVEHVRDEAHKMAGVLSK